MTLIGHFTFCLHPQAASDAAELDSFNNFGEYPQDWVTSGRVHLSQDYLSGERFEFPGFGLVI